MTRQAFPVSGYSPVAPSGVIIENGGGSRVSILSDGSDATFLSHSGVAHDKYYTFGDVTAYTPPAGAVLMNLKTFIRSFVQFGSVITGTFWFGTAGSGPSVVVTDNGPGSLAVPAAIQNRSATIPWPSGTFASPVWFRVDFDANASSLYEVGMEIQYANIPTATATAPTGTVTNTLSPTIQWTFGGDELGQAKFRVAIYNTAQFSVGGFTPFTSPSTYDSLDVVSAVSNFALPVNLPNGQTYRAYVAAAQEPKPGVFQWTVSPWTFTTFTINAAPSAPPTNVQPAAGAIVNTNFPILQATVPDSSVRDVFVRAQWEIAENSGFTVNVHSITAPDFLGAGGLSSATSTALYQRVWFIRARTVDNIGLVSSWTTPTTFQVAHPPTTIGWIPTAQESIGWDGVNIPLRWNFSDTSPDNTQTAFEIVIERDSDSASVISTGKVVSAETSVLLPISATFLDTLLRWRIRVWDNDDVAGPFSANQQFFARQAPVVTIIQPTAAAGIVAPNQAIMWLFSATHGRTQTSYKVDIYEGATLVHTSGTILSAATTYDFSATAFRFLLAHVYNIRVTATDTSTVSGTAQVTALSTWSPPSGLSFTLSDAIYETQGAIVVSWTNAGQDSNFIQYNIYRRECGGTAADWVRIGVDLHGELATHDFPDFLAPAGTCLEYTITQTALRFNDQVESPYATAQSITTTSASYWLVDPVNLVSIKVYQVISDTFTNDFEEAEIELLGRGRRVEYGTRFGYSGTLTVELYDQTGLTAREQRLAIESLKLRRVDVMLKNPFGDAFKVSMGKVQIDRIAGVGLREYAKAIIPYTEVS